MANLFGWASLSETGTVNGKKGDQKQKKNAKGNDIAGEVKIGNYYDFGQKYVIRFRSRTTGRKMGQIIKYLCNCNLIGYGQNDRTSLYSACEKYSWNFSKVKKAIKAGKFPKCNCDCSSLTATGINLSVGGKLVPAFTTSTLEYYTVGKYKSVFKKVNLYTAKQSWKKGDIINAPGHHVIINI